MISLKSGGLALALMTACAPAVLAEGFDPRDNCYELLNDSSDLDKIMVASWAYGFLTVHQGEARAVNLDSLRVMLSNLSGVCTDHQDMSLLQVVSGSGPQNTAAEPDNAPSGEAAVRAMLQAFLTPGADLVALTKAILPTDEDIRAVYEEPLASALITAYAAAMKPGLALGPKPGQSELIVVHTTTDHLIAGDPVIEEFPGGYKKAVAYMKPGFPIVRFKFVAPGKTSGMAFDGLVYVNGHWALIPKPWRSIP